VLLRLSFCQKDNIRIAGEVCSFEMRHHTGACHHQNINLLYMPIRQGFADNAFTVFKNDPVVFRIGD
jgi:hypothetical protein